MSIQDHDDLWGPPPDHRRDRLTVAFVTSLVALAMDVSVREIASRRRSTLAATRARQTAIYLTHVTLGWSLGRVAMAFSRDRTTASHAVRMVEDLRDDPGFDSHLTDLESCIRQAPGPRPLGA
ncbi:MAG: helix-turn-helix domain-containing protein [Caulobacter sp.]|nr:helix-turn-helix domain-containing protein [Caulobacter sp.]